MRPSLLAASRRFFTLLLVVGCVVAAASLALGSALGEHPQRSISVGLYVGGCFLVVAGFVFGNRGPVRPTDKSSVVPFFGSRMARWASTDEGEQTINESAIFVSLGFALILFGAVADSQHRLF
jgi:hypothetical protein